MNKYIDQGFSTLRYLVLYIFDNIEHKYHFAWMDNLYNSAKFFKNAWNHPKFVMVFVAMGGFIREIMWKHRELWSLFVVTV